MTTWPLAATALIFLWMFIRLAMTTERYNSKKLGDRREAIKRECLWTFIVLAYCVMPSNSVYLFRIFQCDDGFGPDSDQYFLTADYSLQCYVPLHAAMSVYSIVMILVYPVGINVMYLAMLLYHREAINPPKDNMAAAIVDRQARPQIRFLSFIYKYYKPTSYTFELVESARRLLLGGLYVFFAPGNDSINTFAAFAIAAAAAAVADAGVHHRNRRRDADEAVAGALRPRIAEGHDPVGRGGPLGVADVVGQRARNF